MAHDYSRFDELPDPEDLARLSRLAVELRAAEEELAAREARLDATKREVERLSQREIPELMDKLGIEEFTLRGGGKVSVKEKASVSLPKGEKFKAFSWFEANGEGGMIRRHVVVAFNQKQDEAAKALVEKLADEYPGVRQEREINPSTLRAWVLARLRDGLEIPDGISVHSWSVASIS